MPRNCVTCTHLDRKAIEKLIISGIPLAEIERRYGISDDNLAHDRDTFITKAVERGREGQSKFTAQYLHDTLDRIEQAAWNIHNQHAADRPDTAVKALGQISGVVVRVTRIPELQEKPQPQE